MNKNKHEIKLSQEQLDDIFDIDIMNKEEGLNNPHLDELLDEYNSYMFLYKLCNDKDYKYKANATMNTIKLLFGKDDK